MMKLLFFPAMIRIRSDQEKKTTVCFVVVVGLILEMAMFLLLTVMIRVTSGNKRQQLSLVLVVYPDRSGQVFSSPYTSSANGPFHETKWRNQLQALPIVPIWLRANWWHFLANCGLVCWPEVDNKSQNFAIRLFCDTNLSSRKEKDKSVTPWRKRCLSEIVSRGDIGPGDKSPWNIQNVGLWGGNLKWKRY